MKVSAFWIGITVCSGISFGQDTSQPCVPRPNVKLEPNAEVLWNSRFDALQQEIGYLGEHPWAGSYYFGDGLGANMILTLAPTAGFAFEWRGCMGVYDRNYGTVNPTEQGTVRLHPVFENNPALMGVAEELVPIAWGQRRYLVPVEDVIEFCNSVNARDEPRTRMWGSYYLRRGDDEKLAEGEPQLPEAFQDYLLSKPVQAEIIGMEPPTSDEAMGALRSRETPVMLNVGSSAKVLPGMTFRVYEPRDACAFGVARVVSVDKTTCKATLTQHGTFKVEPMAPTLGWRLTTGQPFERSPASQDAIENKRGNK